MERNPQLTAQLLAEGRVAVSLRATGAVMDVDGLKIQSEVRMAEQMKQRHRVRAAREGHQHLLTNHLGKGGQEVQRKFGQGHASS